MSRQFTQVTEREYRDLIETLATEHTESVERAPMDVAMTMIAGIVRHDDYYVRAHGSMDFHATTLYPSDVLAYTDKFADHIEAISNGFFEDDDDIEKLAHAAMTLDLAEAVDTEVEP